MQATTLSSGGCASAMRRLTPALACCPVRARRYHQGSDSGADGSGNSGRSSTHVGPARRGTWTAALPYAARRGRVHTAQSGGSRAESFRAGGAPVRDAATVSGVSSEAAVGPRLLSRAQQRQVASVTLCATPTVTSVSLPLRPDAVQGPVAAGAFQDAAAAAQRWLASREPPLAEPVTPGAGVSAPRRRPCASAASVSAQQRHFTSTTEATATSSSTTTDATTTTTTTATDNHSAAPETTADTEKTASAPSASASESDKTAAAAAANDDAKADDDADTEDASVRQSPTFRSMCEACKLLGLLSSAGATRADWDRAELKRVYRGLARAFHPDVEGGDVRSMEQINEAYQLLTSLTLQERASFEAWVAEGGEAALAAEEAMMDGTGIPSTTALVGEYMAVSSVTTVASVVAFACYYLYHLSAAAEQKARAEEMAAAEAAAAAVAASAPTSRFSRRRQPPPASVSPTTATTTTTTTTTTTSSTSAVPQSRTVSGPRSTGERVDALLAHPLMISLMAWLQDYGMTLAIMLVACLNGVLLRNTVARRIVRP